MSRLVVGADEELARALGGDDPRVALADAAGIVADHGPTELVVVALPPSGRTVGTLATEVLADLLDDTVSAAFAVARAAASGAGPRRIVIVGPACGAMADHRDGVRSVAGAGLAMLVEIASATDGLTANLVAIADDVPASAVADAVDFALAQAALNGATIRLDGGRDAVLAADTRAEGD